MIKKTFYEKQLDAYNKIANPEGKKAFLEALDLSHKIENAEDSKIIAELLLQKDLISRGILKEAKTPTANFNNCLEVLKNPNLFEQIIKEFSKKIEGEEASKKAIFLSLCSIWNRESEVPLNTLVSAESSAGKSFICKNIIKLFPKEMVEYRTKITPEAFTYWKMDEPDWSWDGKICYLEDISQSILDSPTFKVMCSEGSVATIVIKQRAVDIEIQGKPVMLVTTARTNPNTEILNRFQIVSLDESAEQTKAIIYRQAKQSNGLNYNKSLTDSLKFLTKKRVFIPFAEKIAEFLNKQYSFNALRLRRDFSRLLDLIRCSAVLHQFQREVIDSETIKATEQDYLIASEVINYIQTATFKGLTHKLKKAFNYCKVLGEFTAKEVYTHYPFVNQKMWYNYLDDLCERSLLTARLVKTEDSKRQVTFYKVDEGSSFTLPNYSELLQNITIDTTLTIDTIDTILTNDNKKEKKEENNCKICKICHDKPQGNPQIELNNNSINSTNTINPTNSTNSTKTPKPVEYVEYVELIDIVDKNNSPTKEQQTPPTERETIDYYKTQGFTEQQIKQVLEGGIK